jgi:hypothetical protein
MQLVGVALLAGVMPAERLWAQNEPISGEQLLSAAEQVRNFVPRDQFDAPPSGPAWNGQRFSYTVQPAGWGPGQPPCAGLPTWDYQNGQLSVSARPQFVNPFTFTGQFRGSRASDRSQIVDLNLYSIRCQQSALEDVAATNAFGVQFPVRRWTEDAVGIFDTGSFDPKWKVYWETQVEGALAREISHNLLVRISGSLQAWPNGSMIVCGTDQSDPTVTTPIDRKRKICGFNGRPDHIEFLNAATGHLLFQIARKPSSVTRSR